MRKLLKEVRPVQDAAVGAERSDGDRREPVRSEAPTAAAPVPTLVAVPDPEVSTDRSARRRFTAEYKQRILEEADACSEPGQIGALLRREGLYSSHLAKWRQVRDQAALAALAPRKRGRKPVPVNPLAARLAQLERENRRLEDRLSKAEIIIDVQKKVAQLLGIPLDDPEKGESN
jgi:transposase-like protein